VTGMAEDEWCGGRWAGDMVVGGPFMEYAELPPTPPRVEEVG
jgi:hypothetical protein